MNFEEANKITKRARAYYKFQRGGHINIGKGGGLIHVFIFRGVIGGTNKTFRKKQMLSEKLTKTIICRDIYYG